MSSVIHTPRKPQVDFRVLAFPVAMALLLLVLFLRLWYMQVVEAPELIEKAQSTQNTTIKKLAPRGLIFDRGGRVVAGVKSEIVITAVPAEIDKHDGVIEKLAKMLNADPKRLEAKVKDALYRPHLPTPIYVGADIHVGTQIAEDADDLPGIGVETQPMRSYPDTTSFTHILGYVWTPNERDVDRIKALGKDPPEYVGKSGIERAYESDLMGTPGQEKMSVDARRRPLRVAARDSAVAGDQLVLTIDSRLQRYASQIMHERGYLGGAVALDPRTGEVLCLVSSPTYDQRVFEGGITSAEWHALSLDESKPMWNRATRSAYPPGSTFKIVTSIAAYEAGKFDPKMTYFCAGGVRVGRTLFKCLGHHGSISYHMALEKSCNSYFYQLGRAAGEDALRKASLEVGLGAPTGLEIGGEEKGIVPTDAWIKKWRKDGRWYPGDTLNFAIGQGFLNTTPIQMANVVALAANNGVNYRPHLVREVRDADGGQVLQKFEPEVAHRVDASPQFWAELKSALTGVISEGTARSAQIPGMEWGGKTGSAEHGSDGTKTHAWFVGFAPAENPQIAICVLVESAGHGGEVAAPVARDIVKKYFDLQKLDAASSQSWQSHP